MIKFVYCVGSWSSDANDYTFDSVKIFNDFYGAFNYIIKKIKDQNYKFGLKYNEETYSENEIPKDICDKFKIDEVMEFGHYDIEQDPYHFEENLILEKKEIY